MELTIGPFCKDGDYDECEEGGPEELEAVELEPGHGWVLLPEVRQDRRVLLTLSHCKRLTRSAHTLKLLPENRAQIQSQATGIHYNKVTSSNFLKLPLLFYIS